MHVFVHKHPFASNPFDCNCLSNARVATIGGGGGEEGGVDNSGLIDDGFGAPRGDVATESAHNSARGIVATPEVPRRNGAIPARWPSATSASASLPDALCRRVEQFDLDSLLSTSRENSAKHGANNMGVTLIPPYLHDNGDAPADRGFECNASDNF